MLKRWGAGFSALVLSGLLVVTGCGTKGSGGESAAKTAPQPVAQGAGGQAKSEITRELKIRVGHISANTSLMEADAQDFKKLVEARSNGKIKVDVFCCGQIGKQQEMVEQVQLGTLEMVVSSSEMVSVVPEFGVFDLPFLFKDRTTVQKAVEGKLGQALSKKLEAKGMAGLGYWENGYRVTTNNKRPIRTPDDLKGLKIRVPPNPDRIKMFQSWGANAGPLNFSELFSALQTGVFDGQENPLAQITSAKLYEVQKYLSVTGHVYTPTYLTASKTWFAGLEPAAQKLLTEAAVEVGRNSRERGAKLDDEGLKLVREKGVQVNDDVDKAAFQKLGQSLYDDFEKKYGKDLVDLALGK